MHSRLHLVSVILVVIGLLTACIAQPVPNTSQGGQPAAVPAKPVTIKVGTLPFISNAILQIAQGEGYFAEQGLAVELIAQQSSNEFIPLLLKGELDVATPALTAGFFNAVGSGGKIKMAFPLTNFTVQECTSIGILARKTDIEAKTYATPAQWKGARVTPSTPSVQSTSGYIINQILAQGGLTGGDVTITTVDLPVQAAALTSGQTDLIYAVEPWVTRMTANPDIALLMPAEPFAQDLTGSMIVFGAKLLDNPAIGEQFATAYLKAVRQYNQGKTPRNVELVAAFTKLEPALVQKMCWSATSPDGAVNVESIMAYQTWLEQQKVLDRLVTPDEFLDTRFAEAANRKLSGSDQ